MSDVEINEAMQVVGRELGAAFATFAKAINTVGRAFVKLGESVGLTVDSITDWNEQMSEMWFRQYAHHSGEIVCEHPDHLFWVQLLDQCAGCGAAT